jgi:hypothetical protein
MRRFKVSTKFIKTSANSVDHSVAVGINHLAAGFCNQRGEGVYADRSPDESE